MLQKRNCVGAAMGVIALDLRPGHGIGPFSIGMPIRDAFARIEEQPNIYDVVHVKYYDELIREQRRFDIKETHSLSGVRQAIHGRRILFQMSGFLNSEESKPFQIYIAKEPLKLDIVISFPDHGFHLRFDPLSQRLRLIEIFDVKRLQMRYATSLIGGPSTPATCVAVYALFGPTFPGIYDKDRSVYNLFYPGLSFAFPVPTHYTEYFNNGKAELPLEFPDGTTPITCRICIYDSSTDSKIGIGSLLRKASVPSLPAGSLYMEEVYAKLGEEVWFSVGGQHIFFGASPQDVWTDLGRPCGIHKKQVDQMVIHSASDPRPRTTLSDDYFYNYFTRGLDILFDGKTHKIKKFMLHSNYPGHADFNSYSKCNFVICNSDDDSSFQQRVPSKGCITPSTKWEQVKEIFGDCGQSAIQIHGSSSSPFGSTSVYGYPNVAFEVMKNGYIATVTLFQS